MDGTPELEQPERFYREAVYREYTALPADTAQAMQALAARAGIRTDGGTAETARQVAQYIGSAARYSLDTPVQPRDEDFVLHFLTQSRQGYCVHFASAAAVMLRALDIPARYVSGYVAVVQGGRADVPDSAAHAWVEYYLDGFGWLPLEATPGFARETSVLPEALLSGEGVPENGESNAASRDTASSETEGHVGAGGRGGGFVAAAGAGAVAAGAARIGGCRMAAPPPCVGAQGAQDAGPCPQPGGAGHVGLSGTAVPGRCAAARASEGTGGKSKVQQSCADTGGAWGADRICRPMRGPTGERERAAAPFLGKMDLMPVLTAKRKEKASEWSMSKLQRR